MIVPYFQKLTVLNAATCYVHDMCLPDLMHFAVLADEHPDFELEVVIAHVEREAGLDTPWPEPPADYKNYFDHI